MCTIMSGHKRVWAQTCLGTIMYGHNRVGTIMSGHKCVWAQTCVGTNVSGHTRVWAQTFVGTNVWGHKCLRAQSCGHNYVWAQTWWNRQTSEHRFIYTGRQHFSNSKSTTRNLTVFSNETFFFVTNRCIHASNRPAIVFYTSPARQRWFVVNTPDQN